MPFTSYPYDAQDRLTAVIGNTEKYEYTYDSFNRRLCKQTYQRQNEAWNLSDTQKFLYQGKNEVGACDATGKIEQLRILGTGKGAEIGAAVSIEVNGQVAVPVHDHNGNVMTLLDKGSGSILESYRYSAFGEEKIFDENGTLVVSSPFGNPWRFSSKRLDEETGFVYFGRRYYDPETSRWISPDPLGFDGGPNLYAYVLNSPLTHIDLYGLFGFNKVEPKPWSFGDGWNKYPLFTGISNLIGRIPLVRAFGRFMQSFGTHLVPIPILDGVVKSVGNFLTGSSFNWQPTYKDPHSRVIPTGSFFNDMRSTLSFNGILNDEKDGETMGQHISRSLGYSAVYHVYNATHGFSSDIAETAAQKLGFETHSVQVAVEELTRLTQMNDHVTCLMLIAKEELLCTVL